jgi:nickel transport protein
MHKRQAAALGLLIGVWTTTSVLAHGAAVSYRVTSKAVEIEAAFDTGIPMANAQVVVYAPDQSKPWLTGKADSQGHFAFTPPADQAGTWQVTVRHAGHGKILNIPVGLESAAPPSGSSESISPLLRSLLGVVVVGGFVVTAILFSRKR